MSGIESPYIVVPLITALTVICTLLIKVCYSSKCSKVKCGNIEIIRDIAQEPSLRHFDTGNNNNRDIKINMVRENKEEMQTISL